MRILLLMGAALLGWVLLVPQVLQTEIVIDASPEKVWQVLIDTKGYKDWASFFRVDGTYKVGNKLNVRFYHSNGKSDSFSPTVIRVDHPVHLMWRGGTHSWLFGAEHHFELVPNNNGSTTFKHYEYFSGILAPLIWFHIKKKTIKAFDNFNTAIKQRSENVK